MPLLSVPVIERERPMTFAQSTFTPPSAMSKPQSLPWRIASM